ncbi:MAG TPA: hypothetical protein VK600_01355 [Candidatus Saccharimonadales bacterium]|nr:hypothetical protein [Candidatus Saccharimonadales bacterium]
MTSATGRLTSLGFRWRHLSAHGVAHLVPASVLSRSTTACGKPLHGHMLLDLGWGGEGKCSACVGRNGGET